MDMKADISLFVRRYINLQREFFTRRPTIFEDGLPVPSAFRSRAELMKVFEEEMKVECPISPTDSVIRFLDGRRPLDYSRPRSQQMPSPVMKEPAFLREPEFLKEPEPSKVSSSLEVPDPTF